MTVIGGEDIMERIRGKPMATTFPTRPQVRVNDMMTKMFPNLGGGGFALGRGMGRGRGRGRGGPPVAAEAAGVPKETPPSV